MRSESILSVSPSVTEGVNVPAVDAVLFMSPRNSQIDIVQAVGRVMGKAEGKECAYIILPIAVRGERDAQGGTRRQRAFPAKLERAPGTSFPRGQARRRDQPDRPDQESTEANHPRRGPTGRRGRSYSKVSQYFPPLDLPPAVIFARIVEQCGDREVLGDLGEGRDRYLCAARRKDQGATQRRGERRTA